MGRGGGPACRKEVDGQSWISEWEFPVVVDEFGAGDQSIFTGGMIRREFDDLHASFRECSIVGSQTLQIPALLCALKVTLVAPAARLKKIELRARFGPESQLCLVKPVVR